MGFDCSHFWLRKFAKSQWVTEQRSHHKYEKSYRILYRGREDSASGSIGVE